MKGSSRLVTKCHILFFRVFNYLALSPDAEATIWKLMQASRTSLARGSFQL